MSTSTLEFLLLFSGLVEPAPSASVATSTVVLKLSELFGSDAEEQRWRNLSFH